MFSICFNTYLSDWNSSSAAFSTCWLLWAVTLALLVSPALPNIYQNYLATGSSRNCTNGSTNNSSISYGNYFNSFAYTKISVNSYTKNGENFIAICYSSFSSCYGSSFYCYFVFFPPRFPFYYYFSYLTLRSNSYLRSSFSISLAGLMPYFIFLRAASSLGFTKRSRQRLRKVSEHRWTSSLRRRTGASIIFKRDSVSSEVLKQSGKCSTKFTYIPSLHAWLIWASI